MEDVITTEYFTTDELNVEIKKMPDNICLIHINAVSLCKHVNSIKDMISQLEKLPSIMFISETRVQDENEDFQKEKVQIEGYQLVLDNSSTNAGSTAIYSSDNLVCNERSDIKFEFSSCEACVVEVECNAPGPNPIFGALYHIQTNMHDHFVVIWVSF